MITGCSDSHCTKSGIAPPKVDSGACRKESIQKSSSQGPQWPKAQMTDTFLRGAVTFSISSKWRARAYSRRRDSGKRGCQHLGRDAHRVLLHWSGQETRLAPPAASRWSGVRGGRSACAQDGHVRVVVDSALSTSDITLWARKGERGTQSQRPRGTHARTTRARVRAEGGSRTHSLADGLKGST